MNWLTLIQALVPVGIQVAQALHPDRGQGAAKAATVLAMAQPILAIAAATGAIPAEHALDTAAVLTAISKEVAKQKQTGELAH